jgi:hypothetical protein
MWDSFRIYGITDEEEYAATLRERFGAVLDN